MSKGTEHPDPTEYSRWWVISDNYPSAGSVHLPNVIRDSPEQALDPESPPPADPLCYTTTSKDASWRTKSHAILPPGYRDECTKCLDRLVEILDFADSQR